MSHFQGGLEIIRKLGKKKKNLIGCLKGKQVKAHTQGGMII